MTTDPIRPAMEEKHTEEQSLRTGDGHPSDADFFPPFMGNGSLFDPGYSASFRLALWLDFFLTAGEEGFKKKWPLLSTEEQKTLGIELLKCYLVQPLFLRLSEEKRPPRAAQGPFILKKEGQRLEVAYETGTGRTVLSLYPLAHHRLWPSLWPAFKEVFFCDPALLKDLEPELGMAAASGLEKIRHRAETLVAFFSKEPGQDVLPAHITKGPGAVLQEGVFPLERAEHADQVQGAVSFPKAIDSAPAIPDTGPLPLKGPQKKKKRKSAEDQMKLF